MKKTIYILSAFLTLAACAREEVPVEEESPFFTIRATGEGNPTKTVLQEDGAIFWEDGDAIKVYFLDEEKFTASLSAPSQTADFTGSMRYDTYTWIEGGYDLWAMYPYEAAGKKDWAYDYSTAITYEFVETAVPPVQTAREGGFDRTAFLSFAKTMVYAPKEAFETLTFYNLCGGVRFSVHEEGIEKVTFYATAGEHIAGDVRVSFNEEGRPYAFYPLAGMTLGPQDTRSKIELRAPEGETLKKGAWYCIACLPGVLEQGFTLRFTKKVNGLEVSVGEYVHREPVTVKRAVWGKVGDADEGDIYTMQLADNTIIYTTDNGLPAGCKTEGAGFSENGDPIVEGFFTQEGIVSHTYDADNDRYILVFDDNGTGELPPYFSSCKNLVSVQLPGNLSALGDFAFYDSSLKSIAFPPHLNAIGAGAFSYTPLEEVTLPDNAMTFGKEVFNGCWKLTSVNIPAGTKQIGDRMFSGCTKLSELELPSSVKLIGEYAFSGTGFTSFVIPDSVTAIWQGVFYGCKNLEEVTWSKGYQYVSNYAFKNCERLSSVTLHDGIEDIGEQAFYNCSNLSSVDWPAGLEYIGESAFVYSGIEEAVLPEGFRGMGDYAFAGSGLKKLVLPSTVTEIGTFNLFANCTKLEDVTLPSTLTKITSSGVFSGCTSLKHIDLPEELSVLGYWTFRNSGLESFTLPKNINVVVESLLAGCENLTKVNLHEGITLIQGGAFYGCSSLESILLPSTLTELKDNAFTNTALKEISIPESVTEMGAGTFSGCRNLKKVNVPSGVTAIKRYLFSECTALEELTLPESIKSIGYSAFNSTNLKVFTLPSTVEAIEAEAFYRSALEKLTVLAATPPHTPGADISSNFLPRRFDFEIRVPSGSVDAYKEAEGWSNYADIISAIE